MLMTVCKEEREREREREQIIMALRLKMYVVNVCYLLFLNDFLLFVTEICYYCCTFSNTQTETDKEKKKRRRKDCVAHAIALCEVWFLFWSCFVWEK